MVNYPFCKVGVDQKNKKYLLMFTGYYQGSNEDVVIYLPSLYVDNYLKKGLIELKSLLNRINEDYQ